MVSKKEDILKRRAENVEKKLNPMNTTSTKTVFLNEEDQKHSDPPTMDNVLKDIY